MIKYKYIILFIIIFCLIDSNEAKAGTYDDAYTFYTKHANNNEPAYLNKSDGYIYFCSWGNKSMSGTKYKTVGYKISIDIDGNQDYIEVKLGGNIIKDVSTVTKDNVVYVLRKARLTRLQELFNGNKNISWYQIFKKKNIFEFDAIMTVLENGTQLCGEVTESDNLRRLSAQNNAYLYRKLSGIKAARNWSNPSDLNNFYNRVIEVVPVSPLKPEAVNVSGQNVYKHNDVWYVKVNSVCVLSMRSVFDDVEAASSRYHPNFNVYRISGWGDDQKYCVMQGKKKSEAKAVLLKDGTTSNKPFILNGVDTNKTSAANESYVYFNSTMQCTLKVPDDEKICVIPEGRVYYNNLFPDSENDEKNLCDIQSNSSGKATIISDGMNPHIKVPKYLSGYENTYVKASGIVTDNGSGINTVRLMRSDGVILYEKSFNEYCNEYSIANDYSFCIQGNYSYYLYARDNVGNETISDKYYLNVNKAHNVQATISSGVNGFNGSKIDVSVFGGNSEINALLIMSEDDCNPTNDRVIITNKSIETHTMESGLYQYSYSVDAMDTVRNMPDGVYIFDVISGGRYVSSDPVTLTMLKDTTPPDLYFIESAKESCGWYRGKAVVTAEVWDNYSDVKSIVMERNKEYIDGILTYNNTSELYLKQYTINTHGISNLECVAADKAGNVSTDKLTVKVDGEAPTYYLYGGFIGADEYENRWINKSQLKGGIVFRDFQSGMLLQKASMPVMIQTGGGWMELASSKYNISQDDFDRAEITFSSQYRSSITSSKYKYMFYIKDRVGNLLTQILNFNVDCDVPYIENSGTDMWDKEKLKGTVTVKDKHSGVTNIKIKCNGDIVDNIETDNVNSYNISIDLSRYKYTIKSASVEIEDAVGNIGEYPLEFVLPTGSRIRTRLR